MTNETVMSVFALLAALLATAWLFGVNLLLAYLLDLLGERGVPLGAFFLSWMAALGPPAAVWLVRRAFYGTYFPRK